MGRPTDRLSLTCVQYVDNIHEKLSLWERCRTVQQVAELIKEQGHPNTVAAKRLGLSRSTLSKMQTVAQAPMVIQQLSLQDRITDLETLYLLSKACLHSETDVLWLLEAWRKGQIKGTLRRASDLLLKRQKRGIGSDDAKLQRWNALASDSLSDPVPSSEVVNLANTILSITDELPASKTKQHSGETSSVNVDQLPCRANATSLHANGFQIKPCSDGANYSFTVITDKRQDCFQVAGQLIHELQMLLQQLSPKVC